MGSQMTVMDWQELLLRLMAAGLLGAIVGLDRQLRRKPTGLRTVTLISIGAALMTLLALQMAAVTASQGYNSAGDIGRVLQGLVAGIGVLGAGVFLHREGTVYLATTGATIWLAGGIGIASGLGLYLLATAATGLAILMLAGFATVERRLLGRRSDDRQPSPPHEPAA
jgi:putative Mg2+ transporter-C (MgtC) family protein